MERDNGYFEIDSELLGITKERFILFCQHTVNGRSLTEAAWGGDSAVFPEGINQFRRFRTQLVGRNLANEIKKGKVTRYYMSKSGMAVCQRVVELCTHTHTHERAALPGPEDDFVG